MEIVEMKLKVAIGMIIFLLSILLLIAFKTDNFILIGTTTTNIVESPMQNLQYESRQMVESLAHSLKDVLRTKEDPMVASIIVSIRVTSRFSE